MFITPSFKKSLIVEQFQGNYLKPRLHKQFLFDNFCVTNSFDRVDDIANICQHAVQS